MTFLPQFNNSYYLDVAMGKVPGAFLAHVTGIRTLAFNTGSAYFTAPAFNNGSGNLIKATFPVNSAVVEIKSADASDVVNTTTNISKVKLIGLSSTWEKLEESVNLNGTTVVNTTASFLRIFDVIGYGEFAAGAITSLDTTTSNYRVYIPAGASTPFTNLQSGYGAGRPYTIPAGHTGYIINVHGASSASSVAGTVDINIRENPVATLPLVNHNRTGWVPIYSFTFPVSNQEIPPIKLTERTDIYALVTNSATTNSNIKITILVVPNT